MATENYVLLEFVLLGIGIGLFYASFMLMLRRPTSGKLMLMIILGVLGMIAICFFSVVVAYQLVDLIVNRGPVHVT